MIKWLISIVLVCLIASCDEPKPPDPESKFSWLSGKWQLQKSKKITFEEWTKDDMLIMKGVNYSIIDDKKNINEEIHIFYEDDDIIFETAVINQNDGKKVRFVLTDSTYESFRFENRLHDFPQYIEYHRISGNEMTAYIGGEKEGVLKKIKFEFKKTD